MSEIDNGLVLDDWQKELAENAANPASLHPELEEYIVWANSDSKWGLDVLKHPLVFGVPYTPSMNFLYNKQFEAKTQALKQAMVAGDWSHYIFLYERPYRFDALEVIRHRLDGKTYWDLLSFVWSDSENLWQIGYKRIKRLLSLHPEYRDHFMDDDEKDFLQSLPNQIRVFRGHQYQNQKGFSYSLAYNTAVWFGQRFCEVGHAQVSQGLVRKKDVIGLILGRNELEIVVDPRHVRDLRLMHHTTRPDWMEQIRQELLSQFRLCGRTAHGPDHWQKVDRNGIELCRLVPDADQVVVRLFSIFHDSQRQDEHSDPKHGHRAADLVVEWRQNGKLSEITDEQFTKLKHACRHHNGGKPVSDPTVGVCWDADRLDLIRVGIVPDPKLLSTEAAKKLICMI